MRDSCKGCKADLGGGMCRDNLEHECAAGGGYEAYRPKEQEAIREPDPQAEVSDGAAEEPKEYIERAVLIEMMRNGYKGTFYDGAEMAAWYMECALLVPAAEVRPVVPAKWEHAPIYPGANVQVPVCSNCGKKYNRTQFCPRCGAVMNLQE